MLTWLQYGRAYRDGHLWCAGGISDQPEVYLQAMQLIQTTLAKVQ